MPTTMAQHELRHRIYIHCLDICCATPGGMGAGGTQPDQIGTQAIDGGGKAALADLLQGLVIQRNRRQALTSALATFAQLILLRMVYCVWF